MQATETVTAPPPGPLYRFTIDDYLRMAELGLLNPDVRTELVDGVIVVMSPKNPPHIWSKNEIRWTVERALGDRRVWQVIDQDSIRIPEWNVPEPDIAIVPRLKPDALPLASEAILVIEVSDSTLSQDLGRKRLLYASAAVPNYWVADVNAKNVHRFADPHEGDYRTHEILTPLASIQVPGAEGPAATVAVAGFFP